MQNSDIEDLVDEATELFERSADDLETGLDVDERELLVCPRILQNLFLEILYGVPDVDYVSPR